MSSQIALPNVLPHVLELKASLDFTREEYTLPGTTTFESSREIQQVWRRVNPVLLPILAVCYAIQFFDEQSLSHASLLD